MIENFCEWLILNRGYSDKTVRNYRLALDLLDKYLKDLLICGWVEECERIKIWHIESFIREQRSIWKEIRTTNGYLSWIKLFLRYCMIEWYNVENYQKVMFTKERSRKIDALTDDEVVKLIDYFKSVKCENDNQVMIKTRNLIIVNLLLYTWLRVNELSNLKIDEVWEDMQIVGKGGKRRYLSIHEDDLRLIDLYTLLRKDKSEYLLVSHSHNCEWKKLSNVSIERIISKWAKSAWIEQSVFPHKLRHTFATQLLKAKANIYHISQLLGHSNLNSTQQYLTVLNCETKATLKMIPRFA